eukprot:TRINITY_DN3402_c0_g2_i4.p1 TRINITY_DN3402_c0_g2~~TRINITY_DN3402_c0_g2_i4.p1  ORF type:complete len:355 (-),score=65.02 TRINITY_DN3402_c0_g2_i4:103-1167(-)
MGLDYYRILGVSRSATPSEISKAYRRLALKYHPLKNSDTRDFAVRLFIEAGEAFDVLTNPVHRAIFDQCGEEGLKHGIPDGRGGFFSGSYSFGEEEANDVFNHFFGSDNPFAEFVTTIDEGERDRETHANGNGKPSIPDLERFFQKQQAAPQKLPPIIKSLPLTLEELFTGTTKSVTITRKITQEISSHNTTPTASPTNSSNTSTPNIVLEEKTFTIHVKKGWRNGTKLTFQDEGDRAPGSLPSDVIISIEELPHKHFRRSGDTLIFPTTISLEKALTGCTIEVPTLDGRLLAIPVNEVVSPGHVKLVRGEGMPASQGDSPRGNLQIEFNLEFPRQLLPRQKTLIKQALSQNSI